MQGPSSATSMYHVGVSVLQAILSPVHHEYIGYKLIDKTPKDDAVAGACVPLGRLPITICFLMNSKQNIFGSPNSFM